MAAADGPRPVTLAELVATLSLAADLGMGRPMERVLRQTVVMTAHCQEASYLAGQLQLGPAVCEPLLQAYERWDGKGVPGQAGAGDLAPAIRLVQGGGDRARPAAGRGAERRRARPGAHRPGGLQ